MVFGEAKRGDVHGLRGSRQVLKDPRRTCTREWPECTLPILGDEPNWHMCRSDNRQGTLAMRKSSSSQLFFTVSHRRTRKPEASRRRSINIHIRKFKINP